ncbi:hypothetical protein OG589_11140 [Sphaerisporangium sp. NBC_01403]
MADRGFASAANRRYLRKGDHHYIIKRYTITPPLAGQVYSGKK